MLDNFEIQSGKFIGVCVSLDNCRLFIGSIPRDKSKNDVLAEMKKVNTHLNKFVVLHFNKVSRHREVVAFTVLMINNDHLYR